MFWLFRAIFVRHRIELWANRWYIYLPRQMATVFIFGQMWILIIWTVNPSHMAESLFSSLLLIGGYRKFAISFQWNLASTETVAYTRLAPPHVKKKRFPSCAAIQFGQFYISSQWDPSSTDTIADIGLAPPCLYYNAIWASLEYFLPWNCWWPLPDSQHLNIVVKSKCEMRRNWKRYVFMSEKL